MDRILSAPEPTIRAILVALCDDDRLRARCLAYLDQLDKHQAIPPPSGVTTITTESPTCSGPEPDGPSSNVLGKRKALSLPQICIQCRSAFSPDTNHPEACLYHDGNLVMMEGRDDWNDGDAATPGGPPGDTTTTDEKGRDEKGRPRGHFRWSCCRRDGARPGCTSGSHVAVRGKDKRRRLPAPGRVLEPDVMRTFEGRVLRPNEFVNENLWADRWDGSVAVGGTASGMMEEDDVDDDDDDNDGGDEEMRSIVSEKTERDSGGARSDS